MKTGPFLVFLLAQTVLSGAAASNEEGAIQVGAPFVSMTGERGDVDMKDCTKALTNGLDPFEEARKFAFDCVQDELAKASTTGSGNYELAESQRENFQVNAAAVETARRALTATTNDVDDDRRLNPCYGSCLDPDRCEFCCCTFGCYYVCWGCQSANCLNRRGLGRERAFEIAMNAAAEEELIQQATSSDEEEKESSDDDGLLAVVSQTCAKRMVDHINEEIKIIGDNNCFGSTLTYEDVTMHIDVL